ncbi:MAG: OadG family protein [Dysgonamonadaceae bacterium]|jgi:Na+-transporting methylmalonyl-CoA/oxaloacetate decarboxylase gamma subunit|nr:OadG family protein [Dysgonamonadaceae bacterium]
MKKYKIILGLSMMFTFLTGMQAQRAAFLRFNEVLVINRDNFMDDYGQKHPWVEIYNSSPGTVNIGGCYLTTDMNNPKMYPVPKGDVLTKIRPYQHVLFWADNNPSRGTFHVNFTLYAEKSNFLALFDSDGRTLIDSITVPTGQRADVSYGLVNDGWDQKRLAEEIKLNSLYKGGDKLWVYYDGQIPPGMTKSREVTPSSNNVILDTNEKVENFKENDSNGIGMTITAMGVVFIALIILYLVFKQVGKTAVSLSRQRAMKASGLSKEQAKEHASESGEIYAVIAMAIYEATESVHDDENTVLTIKNVARNYSPWSSKIYSLRELPKK